MKRIVSLLLAITMLVMAFPIAAFAATNEVRDTSTLDEAEVSQIAKKVMESREKRREETKAYFNIITTLFVKMLKETPVGDIFFSFITGFPVRFFPKHNFADFVW